MSMVERVARAIAADMGWDFDMQPFGRADWTQAHWDNHGISYTDMHRSDYLDAARAAIAAMREPSEAMVRAAYRDGSTMQEYWRAMIDAALAERERVEG